MHVTETPAAKVYRLLRPAGAAAAARRDAAGAAAGAVAMDATGAGAVAGTSAAPGPAPGNGGGAVRAVLAVDEGPLCPRGLVAGGWFFSSHWEIPDNC